MNFLCKLVHLMDRYSNNDRNRYLDHDPDNFARCKRGIRHTLIVLSDDPL